MKKTLLFLGIIAIAFTVSACSNGTQNNVNSDLSVDNSVNTNQDINEQINIESGEYAVNTEASEVTWLGEKIVGNSHEGYVDIKSGALLVEGNKISSGEFVIDMTTISDSEGNESLESHLKSEDFFMVNTYPEAKLVLKSSEIIDSNSENEVVLEVKADLSIKGITNEINFNTSIEEQGANLLANSEFSIDRTKWDIKYNSGSFFKDLGDNAIKDQIYFDINLVANK